MITPKLRIWMCSICNRLYAIDKCNNRGEETIMGATQNMACSHHKMKIYNNYTHKNQWVDEGYSGH